MADIDQALLDTAERIHECLNALLPEPAGGPEDRLYEAMRYSALAPGKRLRPYLTIKTSEIFGVSATSAARTAAAIEIVHAYSLIHDDLPCMDDDDMRRGQPSCHKKFDEATAVLAGDSLLTLAFEILADPQTHSSNSVRCELISRLARAAGCKGMTAGQMIDIMAPQNEPDVNGVIHLQRLKTGAMFAISCEAGGILGNAAPNLRHLLRCYANDIGLVFQVTDDILDAVSSDIKGDNDDNRVNKSEEKHTLVALMGKEKVRQQCRFLTDQAITHLRAFGKKADPLRELAEFIADRVE